MTAVLEKEIKNLEHLKNDFRGNLRIFKEKVSNDLWDMLFDKDFLSFVKPIIEENSPCQGEFLITIIKDQLDWHDNSQFNDDYLELWKEFDENNIETAPLYIKMVHEWLEIE